MKENHRHDHVVLPVPFLGGTSSLSINQSPRKSIRPFDLPNRAPQFVSPLVISNRGSNQLSKKLRCQSQDQSGPELDSRRRTPTLTPDDQALSLHLSPLSLPFATSPSNDTPVQKCLAFVTDPVEKPVKSMIIFSAVELPSDQSTHPVKSAHDGVGRWSWIVTI